MGDFIKELNVIDFLGMLLPGAFLLLLLSGEFDVWGLLGTYWGEANGPSAAVRITLLLVGGYIAGSLLHEAGDLLEQLLWMNIAFDPRTYAAHFTKLYLALESETAQPSGSEKRLCGLDILWSAIPLTIACYGLLGMWHPLRRIVLFLACVLFSLWLAEQWYYTEYSSTLALLDKIRRSDPIYLSYPAQEDYPLRKRMLFDGFSAMCRNLFIALVILVVFGQHSDGMMSKLLFAIRENYLYTGMFLFAQAMLLSRYWRFSYLKYKYCYEDFQQ